LAEVFPEGVANVITGRGESVGSPLINHPKVAMISLTGDVGTGRKVIAHTFIKLMRRGYRYQRAAKKKPIL